MMLKKSFITVLFTTMVFLAQTAIANPDYKLIDEFTVFNDIIISQYQLKNGLNVFLTNNPKAPLTNVKHVVKAGSLHETPGITGIAHLFEHMMFRKIDEKSLSFYEVARKLSASVNASTRFESTVYTTTVEHDKVKELLGYEANRFKNLKVSDEMLDIERQAVRSEYLSKFNQPGFELWFRIYEAAYPKHPFNWHIVGYPKDLKNINAEHCNTFFDKYYSPNNTGLFVTGKFNKTEVLNEVVKNYSDWKVGEATKLPNLDFNSEKLSTMTTGLKSKAKEVLVGFRTPYTNENNFEVLSILNNVLISSGNSLLKRRFVYDENKIAFTAESFNFGYDNGMIKVLFRPTPGTDLKTITTSLLKAKDDLKALPADEFTAYLRNYRIAFLERARYNKTLSEEIPYFWNKFQSLKPLRAIIDNKIDVTKEKLVQFLETYLTEENLVLIETKTKGKSVPLFM